MMIDWTKAIETVPCARNPKPVPCEITNEYDGCVSISGFWGNKHGDNCGSDSTWQVRPDGRFVTLDGAVRNVAEQADMAIPISETPPAIRPRDLRDELAMEVFLRLINPTFVEGQWVCPEPHHTAKTAFDMVDAFMLAREVGR